MFKKSLLAAAAGGVIMFGALTGLTGTAQAGGGPSVHIGIGVPGVHYGHGYRYGHRRDCWLPERYLCGRSYHRRGYPRYRGPVYGVPVYRGPIYGGPVYGAPVYGGPIYYYGTGRRHW